MLHTLHQLSNTSITGSLLLNTHKSQDDTFCALLDTSIQLNN